MKKILSGFLILFSSLIVAQHAFAAAAVEGIEDQSEQWLGKQLIKAIENNDLLEVQRLIHKEAPINFKSTEEQTLGMTPLMVACKLGFIDIVNLLLEHKELRVLRINEQDGTTPLMYAVSAGHDDIARALIFAYGGDSNAVNINGKNCLTIPIDNRCTTKTREQMTHIIQQALQDAERERKLGKELLFIIEDGSIRIAKTLIDSNAPVNYNPFRKNGIFADLIREKSALTPLMLASKKGSFDMVTLLLQAGARPEIKEIESKETALILNLKHNPHNNIVKALLEAKAQVNEYDDQMLTPLMYASSENSSHVPLSPEIIYLLVDAKADLNAQDKNGNNALMRAISEGKDAAIVRALVLAGTPLDISNTNKNNIWNIPIDISPFYLPHITREDMNTVLQQTIDEKEYTEQLSIQLIQYSPLPYIIINIIINYAQEEELLRVIQKKSA